MTAPRNARQEPGALAPVTSILPRLALAKPREQGRRPGLTGSVTFISEWLSGHIGDYTCDACEGLGFCLRCDARGCEACRGGLCESCRGIGLRLDRDLLRGGLGLF